MSLCGGAQTNQQRKQGLFCEVRQLRLSLISIVGENSPFRTLTGTGSLSRIKYELAIYRSYSLASLKAPAQSPPWPLWYPKTEAGPSARQSR